MIWVMTLSARGHFFLDDFDLLRGGIFCRRPMSAEANKKKRCC